MKTGTYRGKDCFIEGESSRVPGSGTFFLFGKGGWIDVIDGVAVAHINVVRYRLAVSNFDDLQPYIQEVTVSDAGFAGMLRHLEIPESHDAQRHLKSFEIVRECKSRRFGQKYPPKTMR